MSDSISSVSERVLRRPPAPWELFGIWVAIGWQSFGGGATTLALIRRAFVENRAVLSDAEFVRAWALCTLTPGINLIALTIVIGRRLAGWRGIVVSVVGLLLPSATLTFLITAGFARINHRPVVLSALRGIIPATVGLGLLTSYGMVAPILKTSRREGSVSLGISVALLWASALLAVFTHLPILAVLLLCGMVAAIQRWRWPVRNDVEAGG